MKFSSKYQSRDEQANNPKDTRFGRPKLPLLASLSNSSTSSSTSSTSSSSSGSLSEQDQLYSLDDDQSPPISPALRSPPCLSSASSISSWSQAGSVGGQSPFDFDAECSNGSSSSSQCNNKEDRATYNTKFAKYHLETYRQNDRIRWNFDFDHNRPMEDGHLHHHQTVPRYQWEPTL